MTSETVVIAEPVSATAWQPFGWVPVADTDPSDGDRTLEFGWGDPHLNVIAHSAAEIEHRPAGLVVSCMYRHDTHTQALMPLNVPGVVAVAPAGSDPGQGDRSGIRAFILPVQSVVVLARGTWHWGPFPLGEEAIRLLNVQGRRYAEDNTRADLSAGPAVLVRT